MVKQAVPLQSMENSHTGAGRHVLNEASTHAETTQRQVLCSLGQGSTLEQFLKDCIPGGTHNGAEKKGKELLWHYLDPQLATALHCLGRYRSWE